MPTRSENYDVVIVGAGPVGLLFSVCLARWGYKIKHIDNRPVPTATGRADGIQPRSLEILKNLGLKRDIMAHHPGRVYEVAFWEPSPQGIQRSGTLPSCPRFIEARYPFTTLLHQGLIERVFLNDLDKNGTSVERPCTITGFRNDGADELYPVEVELKNPDTNVPETVRTKYLFSGEGARSFIREQLGIQIRHKDPISYTWAVMDGVVRTTLPDIQMKCMIRSNHGSLLVLPRIEGVVRLYIQTASSTDKDWDPRRVPTVEEVQKAAKRILQPYTIEWDETIWYSAYPIGQGLADKYTLDNRIFMGGDSCHTHSPKAGQGMNVAFHDAINLAWKIHHVECGLADRSILTTYETERRSVADALLEFDSKYAALISKRQPSVKEMAQASTDRQKSDPEEDEFIKAFKASCEFTSGFGVAYGPNVFNWDTSHPAQSSLFNPKGMKLRNGRVMIPANVTRITNAWEVRLEQEIPLNGSFRIYVFAGNPLVTKQALSDFAHHLQKKTSFYSRYEHEDINSVSYHERHLPHSRFFSFAIIFAAPRKEIEISDHVPGLLQGYANHIYADDIPDHRVPHVKAAAHAKMGFDKEKGGVAVVRPDGHVAATLQLVDGSGTVDALNAYFNAFATKDLGVQNLPRL